MAQSLTPSGRTEAVEEVEEAVEASSGIRSPILDVSMHKPVGSGWDPYTFKVECSGVELAELCDRRWLTQYHNFEVAEVNAETRATGVVVKIKRQSE